MMPLAVGPWQTWDGTTLEWAIHSVMNTGITEKCLIRMGADMGD